MAPYKLALLGGFKLRDRAGEIVRLPGTQATLLLAILALEPDRTVPRLKLVDYLWADRSETQGRSSLRQALWVIRQHLGPDGDSVILSDGDSVAISEDAVEVDVACFEKLVAAGSPKELEQAASLYRGELLEGLATRSHLLEDHIRFQRERLKTAAVKVLNALVAIQLDKGTTDTAIGTAKRILSIDPLSEETHRALMGLFADQGQKGLALKQYEICREFLRSELAVEPDPETTALYQRIKLDQRDRANSTSRSKPVALPSEARSPAISKRRLTRYVAITTVGLIAIGAGVAAWLKPWEPESALMPARFATDTAGRGWARQGVKAGRLNLRLSIPIRWDAQVMEEKDLDLQGFEADATTIMNVSRRELDGKINPQVVVAKDQKGVAHFRVFKWYKFLQSAGSEDAHKWMENMGVRHILDRHAGGGFYDETRGATEVGTLGSGEELTMIPFELQFKEGTRFVWIAYVVRQTVSNPKEFIVFFFHNGERAAEIGKDLVLEVTGSATNIFSVKQ